MQLNKEVRALLYKLKNIGAYFSKVYRVVKQRNRLTILFIRFRVITCSVTLFQFCHLRL